MSDNPITPQGWQPIETAPKDWEPVLVLAFMEDAEDEEREPVPSVMVARQSGGHWWLCGASMVSVFEPLAWMPLPPAPGESA